MGDHVVGLLAEDLRRDPRRFGRTQEQQREVLRNAVRRWHALAQRFAEQGWPQVHISPLPHAGWRFATTSKQRAPVLLAAFDTYVERATRPRAATMASRYRTTEERSLDPLASDTAEGHRQALLTAAKTLVDVGHVNVDELTTIEAIVDPEAITVVLEATEERHAQPNGSNRLERDSSCYIESWRPASPASPGVSALSAGASSKSSTDLRKQQGPASAAAVSQRTIWHDFGSSTR